MMKKVWKPEPELREALFSAVPEILGSQREDGRFGTEPWICRDQQVMLALAAAWSLKDSPYQGDEKVLRAIVRGGDALIDDQDEEGKWIFRKKDHSTWGQIYMPWTYSRWIRTYQIVQKAMEKEDQERWEEGLLLGLEGISKTCLDRIHNIPTHHAMTLFCAGQVFKREDWKKQAQEFMGRVVDKQSPYGWWTENIGPVVAYNYVYSDAFGVYYKMSGDVRVLAALERASRFHANYTYPDGSSVETVDERNPYKEGVHLGNPGFSCTAAGRGYLAQQHRLFLEAGGTFDEDYAANMLLYAGEGPIEETAAGQEKHTYRMGEDALIVSRRPWFLSLSAYACPIHENRFRQDRQNFVSVFHNQTGLIVGGGNAKLQPLWSTFTVGDTSLMKHTPGDEDPEFGPFKGLLHVPERAKPGKHTEQPELSLYYGEDVGTVKLVPEDEQKLRLVYGAVQKSGLPVEGHVTLLPRLGKTLRSSSGDSVELDEAAVEWAGSEGGWIEHAGWRLSLPEGAQLVWPALPHNPYRKAGDSTVEEARLVVVLPFSGGVAQYELVLEVV